MQPWLLINKSPLIQVIVFLCQWWRIHDDVIKWKHFPRNWPFVRGIHRSPVNSPHKGQWRGALLFSLICVWINIWINNREAGDLRRYRAQYDVIVMGNWTLVNKEQWGQNRLLWTLALILSYNANNTMSKSLPDSLERIPVKLKSNEIITIFIQCVLFKMLNSTHWTSYTLVIYKWFKPTRYCDCLSMLYLSYSRQVTEAPKVLTDSGSSLYINILVPMMTSSNGNIFRVTGPLCGEFTRHRWIPRTKASNAELWCLICVWINDWVSNREAGNLRRHRGHYDVTVMYIYVMVPIPGLTELLVQREKRVQRASQVLPGCGDLLGWLLE